MKTSAQRKGNEFGEVDLTARDLPLLKFYELVYRRDGRQGDEVTLHFWGRDASVALFQAEKHVPAEYPVQIMEEGRELAVVAQSAGGYWRVECHAGTDRRG